VGKAHHRGQIVLSGLYGATQIHGRRSRSTPRLVF